MRRRGRITTIDNPYNPFDDFYHWYLFDIEKGYNSCSKVARLSKTFDGMTKKEEDEAIETAIKRLIEIDPLDIYTIVYKNVDDEDEYDLNMTEDNQKGIGGG